MNDNPSYEFPNTVYPILEGPKTKSVAEFEEWEENFLANAAFKVNNRA